MLEVLSRGLLAAEQGVFRPRGASLALAGSAGSLVCPLVFWVTEEGKTRFQVLQTFGAFYMVKYNFRIC